MLHDDEDQNIYMYLIEADGIETEAEIKKTDGDTIEETKENDSFCVYCFVLKEV